MDNRNKILIMAFLSAFVFGLVLQSIPPVLTTIIQELNLSHTQGGLLISFFALPGIFFSIPGGMLADIHGPRKVGIVSLMLMVLGMIIVGTGSSFTILAVGRFIAGIGGTSMVIIAAQSISRGFLNDKKMGIAMGIFNAGVPAGTMFAFIAFSRLVIVYNWRVTALISSFICLALLVLFWRSPELETSPHAAIKADTANSRIDFLESFRNIKKYWGVWFVAISWMLYIAAKTALLTFAPDYFLTVGYDLAMAGLITSLFAMGSLVISPITGLILGRTGKAENYLITVGIVMAGLFLLIVTVSGGHLFIAIFTGLIAPLFPVSVFYLVPLLLPVQRLGQGYGILRICENAGLLLGPFFVGLIYDASGAYFYGFVLMAVLSLGASGSALVLKRFLKKNIDCA